MAASITDIRKVGDSIIIYYNDGTSFGILRPSTINVKGTTLIEIHNTDGVNYYIPYSVIIDKKGTTTPQEYVNYLLHYVDSKRTIQQVINQKITQETSPTNSNMNVNGSVTPITFSYIFDSVSTLTRIDLFMKGLLNFNDNTFGHLPELTNGVLVLAGGVPVALLKNNRDILTILEQVSSHPFLGAENRHILGFIEINEPVYFSVGDKFEVIIRDNLTGLQHFTIKVAGTRLI